MHIVAKIINEIGPSLRAKYDVNVSSNDWDLFKEPITDNNGRIDKARFRRRQEKSIEIIKKILHQHGKEKIVKFLMELAIIEPLIQGLQPRHRDHVVHAINTFILGVYILEKVNFPNIRNTRYSYQFMWKLCGLTHDLGYPLEIAQNIRNKFIDKMNDILGRIGSESARIYDNAYPEQLGKLCNNVDANKLIQQRLTEWALDLDVDHYYEYLKQRNQIDHGIISALAQLKVIDALYQENNRSREEREIEVDGLNYNQDNFSSDIVSASSALFIHNISSDYCGFSQKINFELAPLAFLLFLCDTFQEWDRYSNPKKRQVYSGEEFDIDCSNCRVSLVVPQSLENDIIATLHQRLTGLEISVNGRAAVI